VSITIHIPTPLRRFTAETGEVQAAGQTVGEALQDLTRQFPALARHLYNEQGTLRSFVNIFLNDEDVRHLGRDATPVKAGDTLSIIPSIAGGWGS
jgi:molybdopterin converting factor small subunit